MSGTPKRRKLRSSDSHAKNAASLYNFDNVNRLLHEDGRIRIETRRKASTESPYVYFGQDFLAPPESLAVSTEIRKEEAKLPRRRRKNTLDPLADDVYETFHRRMKKDEKSRTVTDRGRIYFEMDNLKTSLELLRQHDWHKHLPQLTVINDRNDTDELAWKRRATIREMEKTLDKFANWETRSATLAAEIKSFDIARNKGVFRDDEDADDADESIWNVPLEDLAKQRRQRRLAKHGVPMKIYLRNGHHIRYNPYLSPTVAIESDGG